MTRAVFRKGQFLFSKEGVTQGDPLAMVAYGLGILPLILELRTAHPSVTHLWYADDAWVGGTFGGIRQHLVDLMVRGLPRGYFPELIKSILVVSPWNVPRLEAFFRGYGLQFVTGSRYLGSFVGSKAAHNSCL